MERHGTGEARGDIMRCDELGLNREMGEWRDGGMAGWRDCLWKLYDDRRCKTKARASVNLYLQRTRPMRSVPATRYE